MCLQVINTDRMTVVYNKHVYEAEQKQYFDTGSQELACTSGQCDVVDLV